LLIPHPFHGAEGTGGVAVAVIGPVFPRSNRDLRGQLPEYPRQFRVEVIRERGVIHDDFDERFHDGLSFLAWFRVQLLLQPLPVGETG
jgi:hypothetical protein